MVYRPPKQDVEAVKYMRNLVKCLSKNESKKYTNIILGDFNLPKTDWISYTVGGHEVSDIFLRFVIETGYYQLVTHSTRDSSILDLILTNDPSLFTAVNNDIPFGSSDHSAVKFDVVLGGHSCVPSSLSSSSPIKYKWFSGDYEAIESYFCLLYTSPSPRDRTRSRMPSSA